MIKVTKISNDEHMLSISSVNIDRIYTLDEIEDLEINLTDIIKQLQDYRLSQICGEE